jgi:hypothetical protein
VKALGGGVGCCLIALGGVGVAMGFGLMALAVVAMGCLLVLVAML